MIRLSFLLAGILFVSCTVKKKDNSGLEEYVLHSAFTGDDYAINIRKPDHFDSLQSYHILIAADGSIGLGEYLSGTNPSWKATIPSNCIIVTIGHTGNWHEERPRDFIPSDITKDSSTNFGKAELFYSCLKNEIVPLINKKFIRPKSLSFIGHSFSGLFCLYAAFQQDRLFDHYFAISPSVWANDEELLNIEKEFTNTHQDLSADIHIYAGGLEVFNKVLSSSKFFYNTISERNYKSLHISLTIINGANHFSVRKPAVDKILASFQNL